MTVETQAKKVTATGNGSATTFSFSPIAITAATDLVVVTTVIATGVETVRTQGTGAANWSTDLTVFPATGSITYPADEVTPLPATETITIKRVVTLSQATDLENQGGYFAETQEAALDKTVMIDLQQQEEIDRSFTFPLTYSGGVVAEIPSPASGDEGKALGLNGSLTAFTYLTPNSSTYLATPLSSTDNAIVRFDGATGQGFQDSSATVNDVGEISSPSVYGRNLIIDPMFNFWDEGTSFTATGYTATMFHSDFKTGDTGAGTASRQAFTPGQTGVPHNPIYFYRHDQTTGSDGTGGTFPRVAHRIEDVTTGAGGHITFSFWAKVSSGTLSLQPLAWRDFGSGGSAATGASNGLVTVTTSWQKFEVTIELLASAISGKTIGAGNYLQVHLEAQTTGTFTLDVANWQVNFGQTSLAFERPDLQQERVKSERFFQMSYNPGVAPGTVTGDGKHMANFARDASNQNYETIHLTPMRATPTTTMYNPQTLDDSGKYYNVTDAVALAATVVSYYAGLRVSPAASTGVNVGDVWEFHYKSDARL